VRIVQASHKKKDKTAEKKAGERNKKTGIDNGAEMQ
jgi:hypothetical protein